MPVDWRWFLPERRPRLGHGESACAKTIANAFWAKVAAVAGSTIDVAVWPVVQIRRVQRLPAIGAMEATFVPNAAFANHLLGCVHGKAATRASALGSRSTHWLALGTKTTQASLHSLVNVYHRIEHRNLLVDGGFSIRGDQCRRVSIAESFRAVLLAIAGFAVDLSVRAVASQHRV